MSRLVALLLLLAGCTSTDPCAGVSGACLSLTVESSAIKEADTLDITASGAFGGSRTATAGKLAPLPMRVALHYAPTVSGPVHIAVIALDAANQPLGSGAGDATLAPGKHAALTVMLAPGTSLPPDDMAGAGPADVAGMAVVCSSADDNCSDASTLQSCRADGTGFTTTSCALGCSTTGTPHCNQMAPTAPVTTSDLQIAGTMSTSLPDGTLILDTDTGAISPSVRPANTVFTTTEVHNGIAYRQTAGTGIFAFSDLTVGPNTVVKIVGTRSAALVATTTLSLQGVLDARPMDLNGVLCANGYGGPGGFAGGAPGMGSPVFQSGQPGGAPMSLAMAGGGGGPTYAGNGGHGGGGGGGAHAANGGNAGIGTATTYGGAAGGKGPYDSADLTAMHGGAGGGGGGNSTGAFGGGGGGAVQLVAGVALTIGGGSNPGGIEANGCGGLSANTGAGGGAGGAILLEAPTVQLTANAVLAAKGGGGADTAGHNGITSGLDGSVPLGGGSVISPIMNIQGGNGGGGADNSLAGGAASPSTGGGPPGASAGPSNGGGGAAGWIRINSHGAPNLSNMAILAPTQASTGASVGAIGLQ